MNEKFITLKTAVNNYAAEVNGLKEIREKTQEKTKPSLKESTLLNKREDVKNHTPKEF